VLLDILSRKGRVDPNSFELVDFSFSFELLESIQPNLMNILRPLRKSLFITLRDAEKINLTPDIIIARLKGKFHCDTIVVSREQHEREGFHFHVGVRCTDASNPNAVPTVRRDRGQGKHSVLSLVCPSRFL
jgi:hypothetical protein